MGIQLIKHSVMRKILTQKKGFKPTYLLKESIFPRQEVITAAHTLSMEIKGKML